MAFVRFQNVLNIHSSKDSRTIVVSGVYPILKAKNHMEMVISVASSGDGNGDLGTPRNHTSKGASKLCTSESKSSRGFSWNTHQFRSRALKPKQSLKTTTFSCNSLIVFANLYRGCLASPSNFFSVSQHRIDQKPDPDPTPVSPGLASSSSLWRTSLVTSKIFVVSPGRFAGSQP